MVCALNKQESDDSPIGSEVFPQSGMESLNLGTASNTWHQTTQFADGSPGATYQVDSTLGASTIGGDADELTLSQFFARPVLIDRFVWSYDSVAFGFSVDPWTMFFGQPQVVNRISNFSRLRCTLKVKIIITGNGFYYGRLMAAYYPLPNSDQLTLSRAIFQVDLIEASQRPHIMLDPSTSEGGEMELPFFFSSEALSVVSANWSDMGRIEFFDINTLRHAGGSSAPLTVSIFAWSDNVELSIPTAFTSTSIVPQSGVMSKSGASDEYGKSIISKPASALANIAGRLVTAPYIGAYARATQIAASGVSELATFFGYSRPISVDKIVKFQPCYHTNYANTDAESLAFKLSLDSKQETTVDTRVMGLAGADEMSIKSIATRMTYLTSFDWNIADPDRAVLWRSQVHPGMFDELLAEPADEYHFTAMANMSELFSFWRGTIKFRFQIVASAFHRGRMRVIWDPIYVKEDVPYNTSYNYVVDIAEERDFVVEVGWGSTRGMLSTYPISKQPPPFVAGRGTLPPEAPPPGWSSIWSNGGLKVEVMNALTLPSDVVANIAVNVFVCAGDDIEFAAPNSQELQSFTPFRPQSGTEMISPDATARSTDNSPLLSQTVAVFATPPGNAEKALLTYSGEVVVSLRSLLKRISFHSYIQTKTANTTLMNFAKLRMPTFPCFPGKDPNAYTVSTIGPYSYVTMLPLHWVMMSFMGYRGAVRVHAIRPVATQGIHSLNRSDPARGGFAYNSYQTTITPAVTADNFQLFAEQQPSGAALNNAATGILLESEIPYQTNARFLPCRRLDQLVGTAGPFQYFEYDFAGIASTLNQGVCFSYSVGEDFQVGFYVGLPILYPRAREPPL